MWVPARAPASPEPFHPAPLHGLRTYTCGESASVSRRSLQAMVMLKEGQGHAGGHQNCWELGTGQKTASPGTASALLGRGWEVWAATAAHGLGDLPKSAPCLRARWVQGKGWSWLGQGWEKPPAHGDPRMLLWEANQWETTPERKWEGSQPCRSEEVGSGRGTLGHPGTGMGWEPKYRDPCCPFPLKTELRKMQKF